MPIDDRRRNSVGVVACAVPLEGSRVRLCFDDVKAQLPQWPPEWQTETHYTWLECDAGAFANAKFSERQLADIGLTLGCSPRGARQGLTPLYRLPRRRK